jgi:alpha-galactosidase
MAGSGHDSFGRLMVWNPATPEREGCTQLAGHGVERDDRFTAAQRRTFMAQRALSASPIFMGGELTMSSDEVIGMITNDQMLACDQNGVTGKLVHRTEQIDVWRTPHRRSRMPAGSGYSTARSHHGRVS